MILGTKQTKTKLRETHGCPPPPAPPLSPVHDTYILHQPCNHTTAGIMQQADATWKLGMRVTKQGTSREATVTTTYMDKFQIITTRTITSHPRYSGLAFRILKPATSAKQRDRIRPLQHRIPHSLGDEKKPEKVI